jgi:hypothetical protein
MRRAVIVLASVLLALLIGAALLYTPDRPRAVLAARYHVQPGDFRQVAGLRLRLVDSGPRGAPAVILLHGPPRSRWITG